MAVRDKRSIRCEPCPRGKTRLRVEYTTNHLSVYRWSDQCVELRIGKYVFVRMQPVFCMPQYSTPASDVIVQHADCGLLVGNDRFYDVTYGNQSNDIGTLDHGQVSDALPRHQFHALLDILFR